MDDDRLSLAECVTLACCWEAAAPKLGNVSRAADFSDTTLYDFLASATVMARPLASAKVVGVGAAIYQAVRAFRAVAGRNTHLGTTLLLGPLCAVDADSVTPESVSVVLRHLTADDSRHVYAAIKLAHPGGLGQSDRHDVSGPPPDDLIEAMGQAADHDRVARQYRDQFVDLFDEVVPRLTSHIGSWDLARGIVLTQLELLSLWPDSLIARKLGNDFANQVSARAAGVLQQGRFGDPPFDLAMADLDFWLRSDGNQRNPGTTADLIAAGLFIALRNATLPGAIDARTIRR